MKICWASENICWTSAFPIYLPGGNLIEKKILALIYIYIYILADTMPDSRIYLMIDLDPVVDSVVIPFSLSIVSRYEKLQFTLDRFWGDKAKYQQKTK